MNYSTITLGELLSHANETIRRNAMSILKTLQRSTASHNYKCELCGYSTEWTIEDYQKGEPVCPECDNDMYLVSTSLKK